MVYRVSKPPVHLTPKEPVFDIAGCGREETRFLPKVGYCPKVVRLFLGEINSDDLWGMWAVEVKSRRPARGMRPRKVEGWGKMANLGGTFGWTINFFVELQRIGQSRVLCPTEERVAESRCETLAHRRSGLEERTHINERNPRSGGSILAFVFECGSTA